MSQGRPIGKALSITIRLEENLEKLLLSAQEDKNIKAKEEINGINKKYKTKIKFNKESRNQFLHEVIKNGLSSMGYNCEEVEE